MEATGRGMESGCESVERVGKPRVQSALSLQRDLGSVFGAIGAGVVLHTGVAGVVRETERSQRYTQAGTCRFT